MNELSPVPATETAAPPANESPEIATPETQTETTPPESKPDDGKSARDAMQRRINRLTAEKYQERAQRELTERQLQEYRQRSESANQPQAQPAIPRDLVEREVARISEAQAQQTRAREFAKQCNTVVSQWKAESQDFESQKDALEAMAGPLVEDEGTPSPLLKAAFTTDAPGKVLAYLVAHPDVLAGLVDLSPEHQIRKIALIEQSMSKPIPKPSAAPRPLDPVSSSAASSEPDIKDTKRWILWKNKQEGKR